MSTALDMSLDDIIKANKSSSSASRRRGGRGGGGGGGGGGPTRRVPARLANRSNPYSFPKAADYGVYTDQLAAYTAPAAAVAAPRASSIETGTKLYISNLDYGVSNDDIKELFSEVGDLKRYTVHYDRSGRSKGTAEVVFSRREHAAAAVKRYNNVQLDGKPMKIEVVGTTIEKPVALTPVANGMLGYPTAFPKSGRGGKGGFSARPRPPRGGGGGGGGGRGQSRGGRNRGRGRGTEKVSAADLDADLDKYHQEAMQIN